jgi:hypothetical protein
MVYYRHGVDTVIPPSQSRGFSNLGSDRETHHKSPASQPGSSAFRLASHSWLTSCSTLSHAISLALSLCITIILFGFLMLLLEPWDDMQVKHTWHVIPVNWERLGDPPAGAKINLYIALKRESALIGDFSQVSDPRHPRHVLLTTPPLAPLFKCAVASFQIWCIPF